MYLATRKWFKILYEFFIILLPIKFFYFNIEVILEVQNVKNKFCKVLFINLRRKNKF